MSSSEIELNLRLDSNCRTTTSFDNNNEQNNNQSSSIQSSIEIDYSSKTVFTSLLTTTNIPTTTTTTASSTSSSTSSSTTLSENYNKTLLDDILYDCEITDCALLPRTFWIPCTNFKPRCILEQCALEIFYHHVRNRKEGGGDKCGDNKNEMMFYDPNTSGAEWWVQIRPSPKSGRYKMLVQDEIHANKHSSTSSQTKTNGKEEYSNNNNKDESDKGICFHWDKDEDLRLLMGGKMYIHPHISTVTYLTDIGPPTMALNYRVNALTGEYIIPTKSNDKDDYDEDGANDNASHVVEGYISWPKMGKHLSFDGRYLHAAPAELMKKGLFKEQIEIPIEVSDDYNNGNDHLQKERKKRRQRRVTFLVNIWLNYKPFNVDVFPETMIGMLSKADPNIATHILFKNDDESREEENKQCTFKHHICDEAQSLKYTEFEWSMGNSDSSNKEEMISMSLPIDFIQNELGGNIKMSWPHQKNADKIGIQLSTNATTTCDQDSQQHEAKRQRVE